ncbi:MAG: antitoxin [Lysobacterales bacterium CG17_big_fil_post_rev_8_21_14_2_50_64_11]|nr:MAG: antitoxin [Xanthomonadales bacterium CG17_big_fil_post_rev_8_21_14_2_50_64_11]PIX60523.1 MAG: antitoxin [Xanthomonadales bacterium CG_4_10_14_3_um_filter_64_11]
MTLTLRTTANLPDDLHRAATAIAQHSGHSLSRTVADLIRRGLNAGVAEAELPPYTVHPQSGLPPARPSRPITAADVAALNDE